jgi:RimJ/RimL family protein N-acetyltransferase
MNYYFLTSSRLGFRLWGKDDTALATALWGDCQVLRFIDSRDALTSAEAEQRLCSEISTQQEHKVQYWPIFLLATGQHVGCCGLHARDIPAGEANFGVHLRPEFWGSGLAMEAGKAVIGYAFGTLGMKKVFAGHNPENSASRAMLKKLGFVYLEDEFYAPTCLMHPLYVMTAEDVKDVDW